MFNRRVSSSLLSSLLALAVVALVGCGTEIVYRDRAPFNPPADAASGFLGYYTVSAKQTTCGNCHAGTQAQWAQSKHAGASATLDASTAKTPACYSCHAVTAQGNVATGTAGYDAKPDSTYRDVQCESCHGPGLTHVSGVGQGQVIRPLAKLSMEGTGSCGDCHSGTHQPFVEEWRQSGHSEIYLSGAANTSSGCANCHDGRAVLTSWGVTTNFVEKATATAYQPTVCSVCHDPHGSSNSAQLRWPVNTADPALNLCMKCHMRRNEPTFTQSSPHAPQGAVLLGDAGYRPPGFTYAEGRIFGSHATEANPKLCAGCHVGRLEVRDKVTNAFVLQSTGHLFRPNPCLDATGIPTAIKDCAYTTTARSWKSCTNSGCHATQAVAVSAFNTIRARMKLLTDQLWIDTNLSGSMQAAPTDAGMLPTVRLSRPTEWSTTDNRISPAEGAEFNARLCGEYGQANSDNSKGIHNPFLCEALLIATITYVRAQYALPAPPAAVQAILDGPVGGPYAKGLKTSNTPIAFK